MYYFIDLYRYKWAFVGDAAAGCMDNNNLSSDFVPHITRIAKLMDNKVSFSIVALCSTQ